MVLECSGPQHAFQDMNPSRYSSRTCRSDDNQTIFGARRDNIDVKGYEVAFCCNVVQLVCTTLRELGAMERPASTVSLARFFLLITFMKR